MAYASNRDSKAQKPFTRARNVRARLEWPTAVVMPPGAKPKGMHWTTFSKRMGKLVKHTRDVMAVTMKSTKRIQAKVAKLGLD